MRSMRNVAAAAAAVGAMLAVSVSTAQAHPDAGEADGSEGTAEVDLQATQDLAHAHEDPPGGSSLPTTLGATGSKTIDVTGRGIRNEFDVTTDVWAHDGYAYTGTFSTLCSDGVNDSGIWIWDVHNPNKVSHVGVIQSPAGSKANDVRVTTMNSGDVLVLSNEICGAGGVGGFEIWNVDDPANPVHLAHVQTDDINTLVATAFGWTDRGVHNLFLFSQGDRDYVAATVNTIMGNFQIWDITDPSSPFLAGFWGAEQSADAQAFGVPALTPDQWVNTNDLGGAIIPANNWVRVGVNGYGASQNRVLHDVTITADGNHAYLANWDQGLVLLDISDPANPVEISTAIDPVNGSLDGEVNSHSVWPSEDGTIVVEGEEDFSAWENTIPPGNLTIDSPFPGDPTIPATAISTTAGDYFEANPGLTGTVHGASISVDGGPEFLAIEMATAAGSPTLSSTGDISGGIVFVGRGCTASTTDTVAPAPAGATIAIVRRGACFFEEKVQAVTDAGYSVAVIANNSTVSTPWSGLRIWDYADPANPVLASTIDTVCSASTAPSAECVADGTYSVHNVIVESLGNKVLAYVSWYNDGIIVYDVSDPYGPVEVARYLGTNEEGDLNNFWGIYKEPNNPFIYASDRNGGLYVMKLKGKGLQKKGG